MIPARWACHPVYSRKTQPCATALLMTHRGGALKPACVAHNKVANEHLFPNIRCVPAGSGQVYLIACDSGLCAGTKHSSDFLCAAHPPVCPPKTSHPPAGPPRGARPQTARPCAVGARGSWEQGRWREAGPLARRVLQGLLYTVPKPMQSMLPTCC